MIDRRMGKRACEVFEALHPELWDQRPAGFPFDCSDDNYQAYVEWISRQVQLE